MKDYYITSSFLSTCFLYWPLMSNNVQQNEVTMTDISSCNAPQAARSLLSLGQILEQIAEDSELPGWRRKSIACSFRCLRRLLNRDLNSMPLNDDWLISEGNLWCDGVDNTVISSLTEADCFGGLEAAQFNCGGFVVIVEDFVDLQFDNGVIRSGGRYKEVGQVGSVGTAGSDAGDDTAI